MEGNRLIGRTEEQKIIKRYIDSPKAEMIAVYGRRRVGKTFLVKRMFDERFDFAFTGMHNVTRAVLLTQFQSELERYSGMTCKKLSNWFEAFHALQAHLDTLKKEKIILFFDELPWMDTPKSNFIAAFGLFWNTWASMKCNVKIIVCGSATTWMLSKFIGDRGGLYGRVCRSIWLKPFTLGETEQFVNEVKGMELSRRQILETYMIFGGIPYYLDMLVKDYPLTKNVDELFFKQGAPLRMEFNFLFRSLFKEAEIYRKVVETLATKMKGMTRSEINAELRIAKGGFLSEVLDNLISCDFVRKYNAIGKKAQEAHYQLTDLFSLFYLRFVAIDNGIDEEYWSKISGKGKTHTWGGYAFEQVCLHHIAQIKKALSIGGVVGNICSWSCKPFVDKNGTSWKGGQVDLLIDRADDVINVCEIKHVASEYVIDANYEHHLRERAALFRTVTKTKKALHHTFITTYGVARNKHSGIVQSEVKMDDLFE
ncbi:MAG: ATP-binding protein [Bacteroidales bacterium]|nr:ATP-binding protein [Bacteroidales bacterium]